MRFQIAAAAALLTLTWSSSTPAQAPAQAAVPAQTVPAQTAPAQAAPAQAGPVSGQAVFDRSCASCHVAGGAAPAPEVLRQLAPEAILNALVNGKMQVQGSTLSEAERRAVSELLAGRALPAVVAAAPAASMCTTKTPMGNPAQGPSWNGWGGTVANTRSVTRQNGGLTAEDLPRLTLKWAFGYQGVAAARAQPAVVGGRVFAASENSEVHALDARIGCSHWTYKAMAGVRTALSIGPYTQDAASGYAVFFGDARANIYAVDANTGKEIWVRKIDDHRSAAITGAPTLHEGRLYVGVQGLNEEGQGGRGGYACCTFRGSVVALDANTGAITWKRFLIDETRPRGVNKDGVQMFGPAGAGIWSSPTVDPRRRMVYVATGNGYADPPQPTTDAVVALDMNSGAIKWVRQATPNDSWTMGCQQKNPDNPACPEALGPDHDFSASPALISTNGKDRLVLPQKSGMAFALDPDNEGAIVWQTRIGKGSGLGGQWGAATDGQVVYSGVSDLQSGTPGGMRAIRLADGQQVWSTGPQPLLCTAGRGCSAGQGGAVTLIPGAVLSGSLDGGLRAYAAADGKVIWLFDTNKEFPTVNGVKANGGSMEGPGPVVVGGMLYVNSGYGGIVGRPGNVLLAFGLE